MKTWVRYFGIAVASAVVAGLVALAWLWMAYRSFLAEPMSIDGSETLVIVPGSSFSEIVGQLRQQGWTEAHWQWRLLGWLSPLTQSLQAGEYRVQQPLRPQALLQMLAKGAVIHYELTIVEGWTYAQLLDAVQQHPAIAVTGEDVVAAVLRPSVGPDLAHPEGWFLPETYRFPRGTTDIAFLRRAHLAMQQLLDQVWQQRALALPYTRPYDVLVMASIIEKETALASEREQIAGVFVRRLQQGMRLQTDPTVIYGLGASFDGDIRYRDLRQDHPYNTYTRHGLPPTPIALPGRASLRAAVQPALGDSLYFVARGDGSHQFSATLEQHNAAVRRYQLGDEG